MMLSKRATIIGSIAVALLVAGCNEERAPQSSSGVGKAQVQVQVDPNTRMTVEQRNIAERLRLDNTPGSVKHLYIISPESGQVLIYSTVRAKVTSSGKRLSPRSVADGWGFYVDIGRDRVRTNEVLEDDGTYGSSVEYIYWWDSAGRYHQHFFTGGQIIHISDYPIQVNNVVMNLEILNGQGSPAPSPSPVEQR